MVITAGKIINARDGPLTPWFCISIIVVCAEYATFPKKQNTTAEHNNPNKHVNNGITYDGLITSSSLFLSAPYNIWVAHPSVY